MMPGEETRNSRMTWQGDELWSLLDQNVNPGHLLDSLTLGKYIYKTGQCQDLNSWASEEKGKVFEGLQ